MEQQIQNTQTDQSELRAPLSANELMQSLVRAKKVMTKVDSTNFENKINESKFSSEIEDDEEYDNELNDISQSFSKKTMPTEQTSAPYNPEKIKNSKLPDVIKAAMINHPIQQQSSPLSENVFHDDFIKGAKRLMEQDGIAPKKKQSLPPRITNKTTQEYDYNTTINMLKPIIENIIRESIDKIVEAKIDRLLKTQQYTTLNENLVIKVGDSIFKGNIIGVNKIKK
jgi:hypothetical protein